MLSDSPTNDLGQELNHKLAWQPFSDLVLDCVVAAFDAGRGYKIMRDVEYGDRALELSFSMKQSF